MASSISLRAHISISSVIQMMISTLLKFQALIIVRRLILIDFVESIGFFRVQVQL